MTFEGALLDMEKRRNTPTRYDRNMIQTVIKAAQVTKQVKDKRNRLHYERRMQPSREARKETARSLVLNQSSAESVKAADLVKRLKAKQQQLNRARVIKPVKQRVVDKMTVMDIDG